MKNLKIVYWSDYACPYCYIAEARLKKAIAALKNEKNDVEIATEMKSFQLDVNAPLKANGDTQTRFALKYGISLAAAGRQIENISRMGEFEGLKFRYATTLFTNTMDAHRLTKLVQTKHDTKLTERVINNLFAAYFSENLELADHGVLRKIGIDAGLVSREVDELLASDRFESEVRSDEFEAHNRNIHAVPFFVINDTQNISGAAPTEQMISVLKEACHVL